MVEPCASEARSVTRAHATDPGPRDNETVQFTWVVDMVISTGQLLSNGSSIWKVLGVSRCSTPASVTLAARIGSGWGKSFVLTLAQFRLFLVLNDISVLPHPMSQESSQHQQQVP